MAKPTLALIPASQGSKVFSVLPSSGVGDFDFSRGSAATRINSQGLIENVASGQSRLDYPLIDGVVSGCPSVLLEPQRTNLLPYSEDFSNAAWGKYNTTLQSNQVISPDGTLNADILFETSDNNFHFIFDAISSLANTEYNFSIFVKKLNRRYVGIQGFNSLNKGSIAFFDLDNGTLEYEFSEGTGYSVSDAKIEKYPNGWYRLSANFTAPDTEIYMGLCLADERWSSGTAYDNTYSGDITKGVYIFGAMLEQGSFPTSYIPNYGTAAGVTRSAETANGAGDASTFNDSEGVLMVETSALANDLNIEGISISDGSSSNRVVFFKWNLSNSIRARVTSSGVNTLNQTITISDVTTLNKIAIKYKLNDFAIWINGIKLFTDTSGSTPIGLNELNFNSDGIGGAPFRGNTKQIQYFQTALTDSELEQLTSWISFTDMAEGQLYSVE